MSQISQELEDIVITHDSATVGASSPSKMEIDLKPWKYKGYKIFSKVVASDNDFFLVRRFGNLNARVILSLQDQLSQLEEDLAALDNQFSSQDYEDLNNGSFRREPKPERAELINNIYLKLKDCNQFLLTCSQLRERPKAGKKEIENIENWFWGNPGAILEEESNYIKHSDDLMTIVPKEKSPLRRVLERNKSFQLLGLFNAALADQTFFDPKVIRYQSDARIEKFVTIIVIISGIVMLIAPLWILEFVSGRRVQLEVITGFVVVFLVLIASVTHAQPSESLAATAGYAAVLMVFLQINNSGT
ncbi:MAG: hypothetical protein MMC33_000400 [Icmadophila ericetorum]|nr:hypothetical protein [Icmadophila ericetorum]